jgi:hypothetical protein
MRIGFRAYALTLMILGVVVLGAVLTTAFLVRPAPIHPLPAGYGDLTRLGWYAKPLYAPARPQLEFQTVKFKVGPYEGYHDIVILGDSFSAAGWPNYLAAQGWSVAVVPPADTLQRKLDVEGLLSSAAYRAHPPKLFIYESAQRELSDRFAGAPGECGAAMLSRPPLALPPAAPEQLPMHPVLPDDRVRIDARQIAFARDFVVANLKRPFRRKSPVVYLQALSVPRFSSERPRALLSYSNDLVTASLKPADVERIRCGLLEIQRRVEASGTTRFLAAIAPDKRSIYAPDLAAQPAPAGVISGLADPRLALVRLDLALRRAVEAGELDVYLPNDTHWGAAGHRIVADAVLEYLRDAAR